MKLNNKGFAVSTIMYLILVLAIILISLTLAILGNRKLVLDKIKDEALYDIYDYICYPVTENSKTFGNVPSGSYKDGDEYICRVSDSLEYHFFVINEENNKVSLIMEYVNSRSNISDIANYSLDDYVKYWHNIKVNQASLPIQANLNCDDSTKCPKWLMKDGKYLNDKTSSTTSCNPTYTYSNEVCGESGTCLGADCYPDNSDSCVSDFEASCSENEGTLTREWNGEEWICESYGREVSYEYETDQVGYNASGEYWEDWESDSDDIGEYTADFEINYCDYIESGGSDGWMCYGTLYKYYPSVCKDEEILYDKYTYVCEICSYSESSQTVPWYNSATNQDYGFWLSDKTNVVAYNGYIYSSGSSNVGYKNLFNIRPVITIYKSRIEES